MVNSTEHEIYHAINVKMPTTVRILIFKSIINAISEFEKVNFEKSQQTKALKYYPACKELSGDKSSLLCLNVSADNICKLFGVRSGPTKRRA